MGMKIKKKKKGKNVALILPTYKMGDKTKGIWQLCIEPPWGNIFP